MPKLNENYQKADEHSPIFDNFATAPLLLSTFHKSYTKCLDAISKCFIVDLRMKAF